MNPQKVGVTQRALIQRINRKLNKDGEKLLSLRGGESSADYHTLGDFYIVDTSRNCVTASNVDLEKLGKELGLLKGYEKLA